MLETMKRERGIVSALLLLQLILWLGFLFHRSPRFPGSLVGGILAVSGAVVLLVPSVLYWATKRLVPFQRIITKRLSLGALLTCHIYAGIVGSILAILHTGHRFDSDLGISVTASMLVVIFSGFIGRYYFGYASTELRDKQDQLSRLATEYNRLVAETPGSVGPQRASWRVRWTINNFFGADILFSQGERSEVPFRAIRLAESIADLEYAINTHEILKRRARWWLRTHIAASVTFYVLLVLHVWTVLYFGLRWFDQV